MKWIMWFLLLYGLAFCSSEPNNIQFWQSPEGYVVIEEYSQKTVVYRSVEPNLCSDFSWVVRDAKILNLNSEQALGYVTSKWDRFCKSHNAMYVLADLSRGWHPVKVAEPNVPVVEPNIVEPNIVEPNIVEPNIVEPNIFTVWVTRTGTKYHNKDCRYAKDANEISIIDALNKDYTPCGVCKPLFYE